VVGLQLRGLGVAEAQGQVVDVERVARRGLGLVAAGAAVAAGRERRLNVGAARAARSAGRPPGLGRRSGRGRLLRDVELLEGVAHAAGAIVVAAPSSTLTAALTPCHVGLEAGRGSGASSAEARPSTSGPRPRRRAQHRDQPQLAIDEVAQHSAMALTGTSRRWPPGGVPPALGQPVEPAGVPAAVPVAAVDVLSSAGVRRYAVATTLALTLGSRRAGDEAEAIDAQQATVGDDRLAVTRTKLWTSPKKLHVEEGAAEDEGEGIVGSRRATAPGAASRPRLVAAQAASSPGAAGVAEAPEEELPEEAPDAAAPPPQRGAAGGGAQASGPGRRHGDLQRGEVDPRGVRDGLQLVDERGSASLLGTALPSLATAA
jgi:hypothetical protein